MTDQMNETPTAPASTSSSKEPWWKRKWVIGVAAGIVGVGIGGASSSADPKTSPEYKTLSTKLADTKVDLSQAQTQAAKVDEVDARQKKLDDREKELNTQAEGFASQKKDLAKREKAVGIRAKEISDNTIDGDGMYEVGKDIKAGTYKTKGGADCYYAVLKDAKGGLDAIIQNNNISGSGVVSVSKGQYLQLSRCSEWVKQ